MKAEEDNDIRINKYLSEAGVCSRRQADAYIRDKKVTINGTIAVLGDRVTKADVVCVNQIPIQIKDKVVLLAFHKPRGLECTSNPQIKPNIISYINYPERVFTIGRLDKNSEGLILLTNQGDIVNKMMRARNGHEKEYLVTVNKSITDVFLQKMRSGVAILDTVTRPCTVEQVNDRVFRIILTQGLNRQIRRMCEALSYKVTELKRIRVMNIELGDLKTGTYRPVTRREYDELMQMISTSSQ
ncbi:MAG: pseudouridine synthase [Lachnospiraceae bacterium]